MKRRWKTLLWIAASICVVIVPPVYTHFRAKRAVQAYKEQLIARGEKLAIVELIPPEPTNGSNGVSALLAAAGRLGSVPYQDTLSPMKFISPGRARVAWMQPVLSNQELSNVWPALQQDLEMRQEPLPDLRAALEYPVLHVTLNYQQGDSLPLPHLGRMKWLIQWLSCATISELHNGQPDAAWENLRAMARFARLHGHEPMMLSQLVRVASDQIALGATWEALEFSGWSESQLSELQTNWQSFEFLDAAETSLAMERAMAAQTFEKVRKSYQYHQASLNGPPTSSASGLDELAEMGKELVGDPVKFINRLKDRYPHYWMWKWWWSYEEELCSMQAKQDALDAVRQARTRNAHAFALKDLDNKIKRLDILHPDSEHRFVFGGVGGSYEGKFLRRVANMATAREMLVTAIALKRYRIRYGNYPTNLPELVPEFLPAPPRDFMDGKSLRYRLKDEVGFVLYSVGEDGEDNEGDASAAPGNLKKYWLSGRDLVWPAPATAQEIAADNANMEAVRNRNKGRGADPRK